MSRNSARIIKVFIASPGDLAVERRTFKDTTDVLNSGFGRGADVSFEPLGWEDALSQVGRRSQSVINQDVDACDVFILVMWRRWGQEAPDAAPYSSYTEEEFYRALARFEKTGKPTIFVFFKHIDPGQMADPGDQLKKVLAFRKKLEQTRKVLYRAFSNEKEFAIEVDRHLVAYAKGECKDADIRALGTVVPDSVQAEIDRNRDEAKRAVDEFEKLKQKAQQSLAEAEQARAEARDATARADAAERVAEAKASERALVLAENGAKAALDGRIEEARQMFAKALDGTTNLRVLSLGYDFFERIGELDEAERLLKRWLAISGRETRTSDTAAALGNLGLIAHTRGNLDEAEKFLRESLQIFRDIGLPEGQAGALGNLGLIARARGNLDEAKRLHEESLEISRKLNRLEGQASQLGNLGLVARTHGNLQEAENFHRESLEIYRKLGQLEGQASQLGNLGLIARRRGALDEAEKLHKESLEIERKLGRMIGQASDLGNLGTIAGMRGELEEAEKLHQQSLEIEIMLGRLEGQASDLSNLGVVAKMRGDITKARRLWTESRDLYSRIGMPHMVKQMQDQLDRLSPE